MDPTEKIDDFARLVGSMLRRWEKAGCIGVGGYWREPPRALRAVECLSGLMAQCKSRIMERVSGG